MKRRVTPEDIKLGSKVKRLRRERDLSQHHIATELNVSIQQVQKYERGINRISAINLGIIAKLFDKPISYFYEEDKLMNAEYEKIQNFCETEHRFYKKLLKLKQEGKILFHLT